MNVGVNESGLDRQFQSYPSLARELTKEIEEADLGKRTCANDFGGDPAG